MLKHIWLSCDDLRKLGVWVGECCISCHDEEDSKYNGYLCEKSPACNDHGKLSHIGAMVCCRNTSLDYATRTKWARILWKMRKARVAA